MVSDPALPTLRNRQHVTYQGAKRLAHQAELHAYAVIAEVGLVTFFFAKLFEIVRLLS